MKQLENNCKSRYLRTQNTTTTTKMIRYNDKLLLVRFHTLFRTSLGCVSYPKDLLHLFRTKMLFLKTRNQTHTDSTNKKTTDNKFHPTTRAFHAFFLNISCGVEKHRLFCLNLFSVGQCTHPHFWSSVIVSKKHDDRVSKNIGECTDG